VISGEALLFFGENSGDGPGSPFFA